MRSFFIYALVILAALTTTASMAQEPTSPEQSIRASAYAQKFLVLFEKSIGEEFTLTEIIVTKGDALDIDGKVSFSSQGMGEPREIVNLYYRSTEGTVCLARGSLSSERKVGFLPGIGQGGLCRFQGEILSIDYR